MQTNDTQPYIRQIAIHNGCYHDISDFTLKIVNKAWTESGIRRFVRFNNSNNNILLPLEAMTSPAAFRIFCLSMGSYHWRGNQTHLDYLIQDLDHDYDELQASYQIYLTSPDALQQTFPEWCAMFHITL